MKMILRKLACLILTLALLSTGPFFISSLATTDQASSDGPEAPLVPPTSRAGPRAQAVTWTDTDWSGGHHNISTDIETELTPGEMVLSSDIDDMVDLYDPTSHDGIQGMASFGDALILAASSPGTGVNETTIYSCDPGTLQCVVMTTLEEDVVHEMTLNQNGTRLYIPGGLSTNTSVNGSLYIFNGSSFQRIEIGDAISDSIGVLSVSEMGKKIFVTSMDDDAKAYIYRSVDDGASWYKMSGLTSRPYQRAFKAIVATDDTVFVQPDGYFSEGAKIVRYNGTLWLFEDVPALTQDHGAFVNTIDGESTYLLNAGNLFVQQNGDWVQVPAPFTPTVSAVEQIDPGTGNITTVGDLSLSRLGHTSDTSKGFVVTAGGYLGANPLSGTEVYDPSTGNLTIGTDMNNGRAYHASVVLQNDDILVTGGLTGLPPNSYSSTLTSERYNVTQDTWQISSSMTTARYNHTATLLDDGKVLVLGGMTDGTTFTATAEVFDPGTGGWTTVAPMNDARANHIAVLLGNGTVLVAGGRDGTGALSSAELYDPVGDIWYPLTVLPFASFDGAATLMDTGDVLVSGGTDDGINALNDSIVFAVASDSWGSAQTMATARAGHTSTDIGGGQVLVTGGMADGHVALACTEIYSSGSWAPSNALAEARAGHVAALVNSTTLVITGGFRSIYFNDTLFKAADAYGPDGIVVGATDGTIHALDGSGNWTSSGTIPGGLMIMDAFVHHGRVHVSTKDPAKVLVARSVTTGTLVSDPYKFSAYLENGTMDWDAILPAGTSIKVQLRSARDIENLSTSEFLGPDGANDTYFTVAGTVISEDHIGNNWFQYKITLETTDRTVTPIIKAVVLDALISPLSLTAIDVVPDVVTITADEYQVFEAIGYDQFGLELEFIPAWSTDGGSIHPLTGNYTPRPVGDWTVHASSLSVKGNASITVLPGVLTTIILTPESWFGSTDDTVQFEAEGLDLKGNIVDFTPTWAVSGGGEITADGNFSPSKAGAWKVYANDSNTGTSGNTTAVVWAGDPARIDIDPPVVTLEAGEKLQFTASVFDSDDNILETSVLWSGSGGTINVLGMYTATTVGQWTIYANISTFGISAQASVTVVPGPLETIELTPEYVSMIAGQTETFKATPVDGYGNQLPLTIRWGVSGGGPISNGVYSPTVAGYWTVYANASGMSMTVHVRVEPSEIVLVTITPESVELTPKNGTYFSAKGMDEFGNVIPGLKFDWTVSDLEMGHVDQNGLFMAGEKTFEGQVTASATYRNKTVEGHAAVLVQAPEKPQEEEGPYYYFILEIVVLLMLILVAIMVIVELARK